MVDYSSMNTLSEIEIGLGGAKCARRLVASTIFAGYATWDEFIKDANRFFRIPESIANRELVLGSPFYANLGKSNQFCSCYRVEEANAIESLLEAARLNRVMAGSVIRWKGEHLAQIRPLWQNVDLSFQEAVIVGRILMASLAGGSPAARACKIQIDAFSSAVPFIEAITDTKMIAKPHLLVELVNASELVQKALNFEDATFSDLSSVYTLNANDVLYKVCNSIRSHHVPTIVFDDAVIAPCGEVILQPHEGIIEVSINLTKLIDGNSINERRLGLLVREAVRLTDKLYAINAYPDSKYKEATLSRKTKCIGIMGFADILVMLGIPYLSDEAKELLLRIAKVMAQEGEGIFGFPPTSIRSIIGKCSPSFYPYYDEYTTTCLKQSVLIDALNRGLAVTIFDVTLEDLLDFVLILQDTLGARVSYTCVLRKPPPEEIKRALVTAYQKGVKQISILADFGHTQYVSETLEVPECDR